MPPNGLFMAQATARSVPVRPMGMKMPPTFSAPVSSAAATHAPHVVGRVPAMTVDADDQATGGRADARVEAGGNPPCRVVENRDLDPLALGRAAQPLDRPVGRGSVGDQQLELSFEVLSCDVGDEALDVRRLVPHRRDDRDSLHAGGFTHT